ncbi:MAG: hypothetical protein LBS42_01555, partial [Tannerella sp.]|nr:hypothetical protein [Tannerella sp.]
FGTKVRLFPAKIICKKDMFIVYFSNSSIENNGNSLRHGCRHPGRIGLWGSVNVLYVRDVDDR